MESFLETSEKLKDEFDSLFRAERPETSHDGFEWERFLLSREDRSSLGFAFSDALLGAARDLDAKIISTGIHEQRELAISGAKLQYMLNLKIALLKRCESLYERLDNGTGFKRVKSCPIEFPSMLSY